MSSLNVVLFAVMLFEIHGASLIWEIMACFRFGKRLAIISSFLCVSPSSFSGPHHTWVKHLDVLKVTEAVSIGLFFLFPVLSSTFFSPLYFRLFLLLCFQGHNTVAVYNFLLIFSHFLFISNILSFFFRPSLSVPFYVFQITPYFCFSSHSHMYRACSFNAISCWSHLLSYLNLLIQLPDFSLSYDSYFSTSAHLLILDQMIDFRNMMLDSGFCCIPF